MPKAKNFQYVWPKDGPQGKSGRRGFFGRLNNVVTGRGPDVFIQRKGSKARIDPDHWMNWDSYHDRYCHLQEVGAGARNPLYNSSRDVKRYDPHTRRYRRWITPHDWFGIGVDGFGVGPNGVGLPRFTRSEGRCMLRIIDQNRRVDPKRMGEEWHVDGPRRYQQEYDWFWQEAHRLGDNRRQGLSPWADINPNFRMHQEFPYDLDSWIRAEV